MDEVFEKKRKHVRTIQLMMILLCGTVFFAVCCIYATFTHEIIQASDSFRLGAVVAETFVILLILILSWLNQKTDKQLELFFNLGFFVEMGVLIESTSWLSLRPLVSDYLVRLSVMISFLPAPLICLTFWEYQRVVCRIEKSQRKWSNRIVYFFGIADIVSVLASPFFPYYYTIGANGEYQRGWAYPFCYIFVAIVLTLSVCESVQVQNVSRKKQVALLSFCLLPLLFCVVSLVTGDTSYICIAEAVMLICLYSSIQVERDLELVHKSEELTQTQLDMALQQINPHFIYNTLGSIDSLCSEDVAAGQRLLHQFAKYLRMNYKNMVSQPVIPIEEELNHLKTYLEIEQVRFPNLKIEMDIQYRQSFLIPTLTLQPLAENAIEHGICQRKKSAGTVKICIRESENQYEIKIIADGVGFSGELPQDGRSHIGIQNVRKRLRLLCGGTLNIYSTIDDGTECKISIPKKWGGWLNHDSFMRR